MWRYNGKKEFLPVLARHTPMTRSSALNLSLFSYNLKEMKAESLKSVALVLRLGMCQYKIGSGQIEKKVLPRQTGNCKGNSRSCRQWFQWVSHSYLSISSVWRFISLVLICQHIYQNVINSSILKPFTTIRHSGLVFRPFRF